MTLLITSTASVLVLLLCCKAPLFSLGDCINNSLLTVFPTTMFQSSSVTQSCPTLCEPMNCSTPGLPVHHQLPEFTQTHVHRVSDAIYPAISSSVIPFSSCPQSLPASGSFPVSQLCMRWPKYWSFSFCIYYIYLLSNWNIHYTAPKS